MPPVAVRRKSRTASKPSRDAFGQKVRISRWTGSETFHRDLTKDDILAFNVEESLRVAECLKKVGAKIRPSAEGIVKNTSQSQEIGSGRAHLREGVEALLILEKVLDTQNWTQEKDNHRVQLIQKKRRVGLSSLETLLLKQLQNQAVAHRGKVAPFPMAELSRIQHELREKLRNATGSYYLPEERLEPEVDTGNLTLWV
jgi:hypothetical protein